MATNNILKEYISGQWTPVVVGARGPTGPTGAASTVVGPTGPTGTMGPSGSLLPWTKVTSNTTLVADSRTIADTSSGVFTVTLPASPTTGTYLQIADGANWNTNPLTVARNGSTIEGIADDLILDIQGAIIELVYDGTTWEAFASVGVSTPDYTVTTITGATGVVTHNLSAGSIFNHNSINSNFTVNLTNFNPTSNTTTNIVLVLNQSTTPYVPTALQIAGVAQTILWQGGSVTPSGNASKKDIVNFSVMYVGGVYTVFGQLTTFG